MENDFKYDCRWSTDCDLKFIDDFNGVQDKVFHGEHTRELFRHQYIDNIYGPSVLVVVYSDGKPVAARGMWRNDIDGKESYQPGRTCVLSECRGKGVFSEMTMRAVTMLPKDALIYNFPNQYSFSGYMKMGWRVAGYYFIRLFTPQRYIEEHKEIMDKAYFDWWVKDGHGIRYIKRSGQFFLAKKFPKPLCWKVVAHIDNEIALRCKKAPLFALYFYGSEKKTFYNRGTLPLRPVVKKAEPCHIPLWKIDAI